MRSNCPLAPRGDTEALPAPVYSTPFSKTTFSALRRPDTENKFPPTPGLAADLLTVKLMVPAFKVMRRSKLRPLRGNSFTCFSPTKPETEGVVVLIRGASPVAVTCSPTDPTSSFRLTTACCPTTKLIPVSTAALNPVFSVLTSYRPTGSDKARELPTSCDLTVS